MSTERKPHQELAAIIRERLAPCYCYDEADADSPRGVPAGSQKYDDALSPANEALDELVEQLEAVQRERDQLIGVIRATQENLSSWTDSIPATSESPGSNPGRASREHGRAAGAAREFESPIPASSPASGQVTSGNQTGTKLPAPDR